MKTLKTGLLLTALTLLMLFVGRTLGGRSGRLNPTWIN